MTLIIARDRGHVDVLRSAFLGSEILTASAFFDRIRVHAFIKNKKLVRDDFAPTAFLAKLLSANNRLYAMPHFLSLYSACYHGTKSPKEVYDAIEHSNFSFVDVFKVLKEVEESMAKSFLASNVQALFYAWRWIISEGDLPYGFTPGMRLEFFHLVDLTMLEIEILKSLSRLGVFIKLNFLWDFHERGINAPVNFIASQFESCADLENIDIVFEDIDNQGSLGPLVRQLFSDDKLLSYADLEVDLLKAKNVIEEAEIIAQKIALIKAKNPTDSIAITVRSLDDRSLIYKQAIMAFGISVRDRKGILLLDSPAGLLLISLLRARSYSFLRKDLVSLMLHPCFVHKIKDDKMRSLVLGLMDKIGIDDNMDLLDNNYQRYVSLIDRLKNVSHDEEEKTSIDLFDNWISSVKNALSCLKENDSLYGYLTSLKIIIDETFTKEDLSDPSIDKLKNTIQGFLKSLSLTEDTSISLKDFLGLVSTLLGDVTLPPKDCDDADAVFFLPLPELLGKKFNHVFVADISIGRMPKNTKSDPLMNDECRIALNRYFKMPFLRVFFDDPFEPLPVPPRQALEPLWFLGAVASVEESIHFSYAERDENNQEQAPSEFFLWLSSNLTIDKTSSDFLPVNEQEHQFMLARMGKVDEDCLDIKRAFGERRKAYLAREAGLYAFSFEKNAVLHIFDGRLGKNPSRLLTPSLIQAFTPCRYKGFLQRLIKVEREEASDDIEALVIGRIAHSVLESYFTKHKNNILRGQVRDVIGQHISQAVRNYTKKNFVKNLLLLKCHAHGLIHTLSYLIETMQKMSWYGEGKLLACEKDFLSNDQALVFKEDDASYIVSGRVDRIDQLGKSFLVTDYKLAKSDALRAEMRNSLTTNMQVPIYLRLVAKNISHSKNTYFAYASIRDGVVVFLSPEKNAQVYDAIFDDNNEESLPKILHGIFSPMVNGKILATPGAHCLTCDFHYICRAKEIGNHA